MTPMHAATTSSCCPACGTSACSALECMQRPRFFGGQLLTERELNAFMDYTLAKNRLHNRMLHGSGTVCGLRVVPHECPGWIRIEPGYAIDPCGNDILVCEPYDFDLLKAIRAQCARERRDADCNFRRPKAEPDCLDKDQVWCLSLRFDEQSIRPVAPLRRDRKRACKSCGTSGRCGCGTCKSCGTEPQKCSCAPSRAREPVECEPTRIAEGFQIELCRGDAKCGEPSTKLDRTALGRLRGMFGRRRLDGSQYTPIASPCAALIPPCPEPDGENVCLACVRVGANGDLEICELSCRTFAGSFPTLNYWFPIGSVLLTALCKLCCDRPALSQPPFILSHLPDNYFASRPTHLPTATDRDQLIEVAEAIIDALPDAINRGVSALFEPTGLIERLRRAQARIEGFAKGKDG